MKYNRAKKCWEFLDGFLDYVNLMENGTFWIDKLDKQLRTNLESHYWMQRRTNGPNRYLHCKICSLEASFKRREGELAKTPHLMFVKDALNIDCNEQIIKNVIE